MGVVPNEESRSLFLKVHSKVLQQFHLFRTVGQMGVGVREGLG